MEQQNQLHLSTICSQFVANAKNLLVCVFNVIDYIKNLRFINTNLESTFNIQIHNKPPNLCSLI